MLGGKIFKFWRSLGKFGEILRNFGEVWGNFGKFGEILGKFFKFLGEGSFSKVEKEYTPLVNNGKLLETILKTSINDTEEKKMVPIVIPMCQPYFLLTAKVDSAQRRG